MKNVKRIFVCVAFALLLSVALSMCICAANAFDAALCVGRGNAVVTNGLAVKLEPLSSGTEIKDMFSVPVVVNESTYIPFRFVFEKMGITVSYDVASKGITLTKQNSKIPVYGVSGRTVDCNKVEIKDTTVIFYHSDGNVTTENADVYKYLGMTYIPARFLERFGALIKWDAKTSVVYISYEDTEGFSKKFDRIYYMTDAKQKAEAVDFHFEKIVTSSSLKTELDKYLSNNNISFNSQNGGLVELYNGKNYYPNLGIEKDGWYNKVGDNARQLCYATDGVNKYMYYVDRNTQKLRRINLETTSSEKDVEVKLPGELSGKKITHITCCDGNLFYVAYDYSGDGGHIYMSKIGSEEKSTVKVTKDKAWTYYISPTYKLYYHSFGEGYRLTSIDLRALENTGVFVDNPNEGVYGYIVNFTPMQNFAFDCDNATDYYYTDINNGDLIKSSRNHNTGVEILKKGNETVLRHFLNVATFGSKKSVLYVEYPNGRSLAFEKCRIVQYCLDDKTTNVLYDSNFAINGLCVYGGKIFFTDMEYSALYMLEYSGSELKVSKVGR